MNILIGFAAGSALGWGIRFLLEGTNGWGFTLVIIGSLLMFVAGAYGMWQYMMDVYGHVIAPEKVRLHARREAERAERKAQKESR